jgi:parvulin-like peptidyl-prolyl isomerase
MEEIKENEKIVKKSKRMSNNFKFTSIVIGVLLVLSLGYLFYGDEIISGGEFAAKVNGERINVEDIDRFYNSISPEQQLTTSKSDVLDSLVRSKVIYNEAKKQGYSTSKVEADQELEKILLSTGLDKAQFFENLELQGMSESDFYDQFKEQISVQKFVKERIVDKIEISEDDLKNYYSDNIKLFEQGEQVTVKHILIGDEELSEEEKSEKATKLLSEVNADNFCDYVKEHSTDVSSVPNCGEYSFGRQDPFVQEFKDLGFSQEIGEIGIAITQFGPHIIQTVSKSTSGFIDFSDVSEQIEELIKNEKTVEEYDLLYESLKDDNSIQIVFEEL